MSNHRKSGKDKSVGREIPGLLMVIVASFIFLCICIPPLLGVVSEFTHSVVVGFFGLFAYPLFLGLGFLGVMFMRGKSVQLERKYIVSLTGAVVSGLLVLHLATSQRFLGEGFYNYAGDSYASKTTVGGVLFGLIDYPMAAHISPVLTYIIWTAVFALCGLFFVNNKFLKERRVPVAQTKIKRDNFRDYPDGVVEKKAYEEKKPELFVSNIFETDTPKTPFFSGGGTASGGYRQNESQSAALEALYPQHKEYVYNSKQSAKDALYGDAGSAYSAYGYDTGKIQSYSSNNAFSGSFAVSNNAPTKEDAYKTLYGNSAGYQGGYQTQEESLAFLYGDKSQGTAAPDLRKSYQQPHTNPYNQQYSGYEEKQTYGGNYQLPAVDEPKKVVHMEGKPQKVVHPEPKKYDIIVPKVNNPESKYINNPNPIISGVEKAKQIIDEHRKKTALSAAAAVSLFPDQFKQGRKDESGFSELSKFYGNQETPENTQPAKESKPVEEVKGNLFEREKGNFLEREKDIERMLSEENGQKAAESLETSEAEDGRVREIKPLDFDPRVNYKNKASADEPADFTGAYKVLPAEKPKEQFEDRVKAIEEGWMSMKHHGKKNKVSENQIGIADYAAEAAKSGASEVKRFRRTDYIAPPIDLLINLTEIPNISGEELFRKGEVLKETLKNFKIPAEIACITPGPAVTRYEVQVTQPGINLNGITQLTKNIAYSLASNANGIRIEAPIPNKSAIGIEVPNERIFTVGLRDLMTCPEFVKSSSPLTFALGKDIGGANIVCDLAKMPHLLIAGATGSGKSACLNALITSIIYKSSPDEVRLILIDPKRVEFRGYEGLPHLYIKEIITEPEDAVNALGWAIEEMERRYNLFAKSRSKNVGDFNASAAVKSGELPKLPYIVLIVDELGDLMLNAKREVEDRIRSLTQKARAAGIHLVIATQRPSVDVVTGTIKANLPSRIAFMVTCFADSKTILDKSGAEKLLGRGDMLYAPIDSNDPRRIQGAFITEPEVNDIVAFVSEHNPTDYDDEASAKIFYKPPEVSENNDFDDEERDVFDALLPKALLVIIESGKASTTFIQRKLGVGYARAAKIIDQLEERKFISPGDASNQRDINIGMEKFREIFGDNV